MKNDQQFELPITITNQIRLLSRELQRYSVTVESQLGVKATDLWFLQILEHSPDLRLGEIAKRLAILQGSASNILERLVKAGYVVRTQAEKDKRGVHLRLTEQGADLLRRVPENARCPLRKAMESWQVDELGRLSQELKHLLKDVQLLTQPEESQDQS